MSHNALHNGRSIPLTDARRPRNRWTDLSPGSVPEQGTHPALTAIGPEDQMMRWAGRDLAKPFHPEE